MEQQEIERQLVSLNAEVARLSHLDRQREKEAIVNIREEAHQLRIACERFLVRVVANPEK